MTMKYLHPYLYEIVHDLVQQSSAESRRQEISVCSDSQ